MVYNESARKRIGLAEKLRQLPLSFFGQRDLSDLTSAVMKDCADHERMFSHVMPQLFGAAISTAVVAVCLVAFDWRLALAALWPIPVAVAVLLSTTRLQQAAGRARNEASLELADGIQEYLECAREIRATNQVPAFLERVGERVDAFEHAKIRAELTAGVSASSAQALLRLGIGTTVLAGALLIADGQVDFMVFFCFLLAVTRVYDPVNVILQTIIELLDLRLNIARLQAIEEEPAQMCIRDRALAARGLRVPESAQPVLQPGHHLGDRLRVRERGPAARRDTPPRSQRRGRLGYLPSCLLYTSLQGGQTKVAEILDVSLRNADGGEVAVSLEDGTMTVRVRMTDAMRALDPKTLKVSYVADDGKVQGKDTWVDGDDLCFATEHFSTYVVTGSERQTSGGEIGGGSAGGSGTVLPGGGGSGQDDAVKPLLAPTGDTLALPMALAGCAIAAALVCLAFVRGGRRVK